MFTNVAQDIAALVDQPEELIRVLSQLANCASTLDHYGGLQVEYDGYHHSTNTVETYQWLNDDTDGWTQNGQFPKAGGRLVNRGANVIRQNNRFVIDRLTLGVDGVWVLRSNRKQRVNDLDVNLVTDGDVVVNNLIVVGNILNRLGNWVVIGNVLVWVMDNNLGFDVVSFGDQTITLTDNNGTAPRVPGCYDPYAADLYSVATNFHAYSDVIDLRNDFTVAIRLKIKYNLNANEHYWSYREDSPPFTVKSLWMTGEWALDGGVLKCRIAANVTPENLSPSGVGVSARVGREYPDGTCLAVFMRWKQSTKVLTLNVLRPGDAGGSATNEDAAAWPGHYGDYIKNGGSEPYLQIKGEGVPQAAFYFERFAIWNHRLEDSAVVYEFTY